MSNENKTLIHGGIVATLDADDTLLNDGAVLIEGERIAAVGDSAELLKAHPDADRIDADGRVVMPGLINAHMHLYSTYSCGIAAEPAGDFVGILENLWWKLDKALTPDSLRPSAMMPFMEGLLGGTTTMIDHHASPSCIPGSLEALEDAAREAGMRVNLCYELSDRGGDREADEGIKENARHLERCAARKDPMVSGAFGLHASFTVSEASLRRAVEITRGLDAGFHVHVAEDLADQKDCINRTGKRVVERFHEAGVLGRKTIAAHCVHVDENEKKLLADSGTIVVTNPQSNMNNAVGATDLLGLLKAGVFVGLGTDGMTARMLDEVRVLPLIQRHLNSDPRVAFGESVEILLKNNARIASTLIGDRVGELSKGALADVIIADYVPFTPLSMANLGGHLLFGIARGRIDTTIVNGRIRVRKGELVDLDAAAIRRAARASVEDVWSRF